MTTDACTSRAALRRAGSGSERARRTLDGLRSRIASGEWPVNGRIPSEPELIEMLGVGRTTVREAVRSLATLGMLETLPGIGTFVRSRTPVSSLLTDWLADFDVEEVLEYRAALELHAVRLAAAARTQADLDALSASLNDDRNSEVDYPVTRRIDVERGRTPGQFHALLLDAAHNRLLAALYAGTLAVIRANVDSGVIRFASSHTERQADHAAILSAIEAADPAGAAAAMSFHIVREWQVHSG